MGKAWQEIKTLHAQSTFGAKEGFAFKYFSRPLASVILYLIKDSRWTPNQITILSLLVGVAGSLVHMTIWTWGGLVLGGALFMLAHVLDALDGQLARHRKAGSTVGMHFDFFIDEVKAYLMYVALGLRLYFQAAGAGAEGRLPFGDGDFASPTLLLDRITAATGWPTPWLLALVVIGLMGLALGISCTQFLKLQAWKEAFPTRGDARPKGIIGAIERVGHFIVDYPSYIVPLCLLNRVDIYLILYTLVVCAYAARTLLQISARLWRVNPYSSDDRS